jgi:hypothetical protein
MPGQPVASVNVVDEVTVKAAFATVLFVIVCAGLLTIKLVVPLKVKVPLSNVTLGG